MVTSAIVGFLFDAAGDEIKLRYWFAMTSFAAVATVVSCPLFFMEPPAYGTADWWEQLIWAFSWSGLLSGIIALMGKWLVPYSNTISQGLAKVAPVVEAISGVLNFIPSVGLAVAEGQEGKKTEDIVAKAIQNCISSVIPVIAPFRSKMATSPQGALVLLGLYGVSYGGSGVINITRAGMDLAADVPHLNR